MSLNNNLNKILIIDFGSQFTQLIARRIREFGVFSEIISHKKANNLKLYESHISGIVLSGGPLNVYQNDSNSIVLTKDGNLYVCGFNRVGELGLGHTTDVNQFTPLEPAVVEASANWSFGSILAWTYDLVSFIAQIIARVYQSLFNSAH